jgi:hypothetical protein
MCLRYQYQGRAQSHPVSDEESLDVIQVGATPGKSIFNGVRAISLAQQVHKLAARPRPQKIGWPTH